MLSYLRQGWTKTTRALAVAGAATCLWANLSSAPPIATSQQELEHRLTSQFSKEGLPPVLANTAFLSIIAAVLLGELKRAQRYARNTRETSEKIGPIDWLVQHPLTTGMTVSAALTAESWASTIGIASQYPLAAVAVGASAAANTAVGGAILGYALEHLRWVRPPILKNFLPMMLDGVKSFKPDLAASDIALLTKHSAFKKELFLPPTQENSIAQTLEMYCRAVKLISDANYRSDAMFGRTIARKVNRLIRRTFSDSQTPPCTLDELAKQLVTTAQPYELVNGFQNRKPEQGTDAAYLALALLSARGQTTYATPFLEQLLASADPERIEDYDVYRINLRSLGRTLILKQANKQILAAEQANLENFLLDNRDPFVEAAWSFGIFDTSHGPTQVQTAIEAANAADALLTRGEELPSVFRAPAAVHTTLTSYAPYKPETTLGKIAGLAISPEAQEAVLRVLGRERPLVFDGDSQLLNLALPSREGVILYELEPRGSIPPEADVARTVGLIPPRYGIAAINHAIAKGYLARAPSVAKRQTPTEFIRDVHLNVPIRALSFAAGMSERPSQYKYVRTFLERGLMSINISQESCTDSMRHYLAAMRKGILSIQERFS